MKTADEMEIRLGLKLWTQDDHRKPFQIIVERMTLWADGSGEFIQGKAVRGNSDHVLGPRQCVFAKERLCDAEPPTLEPGPATEAA